MELEEFLKHVDSGKVIKAGSEAAKVMHKLADDARKITSKINSEYHTSKEIRELISELTGREVDEGFALFPPFTTDCGKNIIFGKNVFINSGCRFQDQGGIN